MDFHRENKTQGEYRNVEMTLTTIKQPKNTRPFGQFRGSPFLRKYMASKNSNNPIAATL